MKIFDESWRYDFAKGHSYHPKPLNLDACKPCVGCKSPTDNQVNGEYVCGFCEPKYREELMAKAD